MTDTITITAPDWQSFWLALERELHAERIDVAAWPHPTPPTCALCGAATADLIDGRCQDCLHDDLLWIDALQDALDDIARDPRFALAR